MRYAWLEIIFGGLYVQIPLGPSLAGAGGIHVFMHRRTRHRPLPHYYLELMNATHWTLPVKPRTKLASPLLHSLAMFPTLGPPTVMSIC